MKKTLPIFLTTLFLVESAVALWMPRITTQRDFAILNAKRELAHQSLDARLIIMGDSAAGLGVDAKLLEEKTGLKTVNLALLAPCNKAAHLLLLKDYLRQNPKPQAILLMHAFDIWWRDLRMTEPWPPGAGQTDQTDILARLFGWDFWKIAAAYQCRNQQTHVPFYRFFHTLLPSQNYSEDLRQMISKPVDFWSQASKRRRQHEYAWQHMTKDQGNYRYYLYAGSQVPVQDMPSVRRDAKDDWVWMRSHTFTVSAFNKDSLDQFLRFTAKEGIEVWIAFPPLWNGFRSRPKATVFLKSHNFFLNELAENHPHVHLLTEDFYWAKNAEMLNSVEHLNLEGQRRFTAELAQTINLRIAKAQPAVNSPRQQPRHP